MKNCSKSWFKELLCGAVYRISCAIYGRIDLISSKQLSPTPHPPLHPTTLSLSHSFALFSCMSEFRAHFSQRDFRCEPSSCRRRRLSVQTLVLVSCPKFSISVTLYFLSNCSNGICYKVLLLHISLILKGQPESI